MKATINERQHCSGGFSLLEVVVSMVMIAVTVAAIVTGYIYSARQAELAAYQLAGESLALQRIEQMRAAKWDILTTPEVDELVAANFPTQTNVLDLPQSGGNAVMATNFTTISDLSTTPPLRRLQVSCVWSFPNRGLFTNTIVTYRSPDQ